MIAWMDARVHMRRNAQTDARTNGTVAREEERMDVPLDATTDLLPNATMDAQTNARLNASSWLVLTPYPRVMVTPPPGGPMRPCAG